MSAIIKQIPPVLLLVSSHRTTIPQIPKIAEQVVDKLYDAAERAGLEVIGPSYFIYYGADGSMDKEFLLDIGLPISDTTDKEIRGFAVKSTDPFQCVSIDYTGPMTNIQQGYGQLMEAIQAQGLQPVNECREIYKYWVGFDSSDNITELQQGIEMSQVGTTRNAG